MILIMILYSHYSPGDIHVTKKSLSCMTSGRPSSRLPLPPSPWRLKRTPDAPDVAPPPPPRPRTTPSPGAKNRQSSTPSAASRASPSQSVLFLRHLNARRIMRPRSGVSATPRTRTRKWNSTLIRDRTRSSPRRR